MVLFTFFHMRNSKLTSCMIICELFTYLDCYGTIVSKTFCSFVIKFGDEISSKQMQDSLNNYENLQMYHKLMNSCPSIATPLVTYERL